MKPGGKSKPISSAALLPVGTGFILLKKMALSLLQGLLLYRENMKKISAISQRHLSQTPQGKCLWGIVKIAVSKPGLDS